MTDGFFMVVSGVALAYLALATGYELLDGRATRRKPQRYPPHTREMESICHAAAAAAAVAVGHSVYVSFPTLTTPITYTIRDGDGAPIDATVIDLLNGVVLHRDVSVPTLWLRTQTDPRGYASRVPHKGGDIPFPPVS